MAVVNFGEFPDRAATGHFVGTMIAPKATSRIEHKELRHDHFGAVEQLPAQLMRCNVAGRNVVSMIVPLATIDVASNLRFSVIVGTESEAFCRPPGGDVDTQQVVDFRRKFHNGESHQSASR